MGAAWWTGGLAALCCCALAISKPHDTAAWRSDAQLRAMADEMPRSMTLRLNNLDKPYFVQYTSEDSAGWTLAAELGGVTQRTQFRARRPGVSVRVGDYAFDNSNSVYATPMSFGLFPLDDDYGVMRAALWRSTDGLYKRAVDGITRKRNALREIADTDKTPDLAHAKPLQSIEPVERFDVDQAPWEDAVRAASARFQSHPGVLTSSVRLQEIGLTYRLVNSEGTVVRTPQELALWQVRASSRSKDGQLIWNQAAMASSDLHRQARPEVLTEMAERVASETEELAKVAQGDEFSGPVLFEGEAAAQMMAQILTDAIRLRRKPVAMPGTESPATEVLDSVWSARVGAKVAPNWLTVFDDPLAESFGGEPLAGYYRIDDEGVPAQRVSLVENGALKGFLTSREPVRKLNGSNGHGRLPGPFGAEQAVIGNLFVETSQPLAEASLRARLIEKVKSAGLPFGLVVRKIDFPATVPLGELQSMARQAWQEGFSRTLNQPLLVFKIYPDGREQLVRGLRFGEFSAKDLRDVDAASDKPFVLNYVNNGSSLNAADFSSDLVVSSVICPSLLFDSVDLAPAQSQGNTAPVVAPPALTAAAR